MDRKFSLKKYKRVLRQNAFFLFFLFLLLILLPVVTLAAKDIDQNNQSSIVTPPGQFKKPATPVQRGNNKPVTPPGRSN